MKIVYQPLAKEKLLFRIENLMDPFDKDAETVSVNITAITSDLWINANPGVERPPNSLEEMSVTGNMPVEEMD